MVPIEPTTQRESYCVRSTFSLTLDISLLPSRFVPDRRFDPGDDHQDQQQADKSDHDPGEGSHDSPPATAFMASDVRVFT